MRKKIDDTPGYHLGLVLFSLTIPIVGGVSYWMAHQLRDVDRTSMQLTAPEAPATPAAEAPAAAEPAAEAPAAEAPAEATH